MIRKTNLIIVLTVTWFIVGFVLIFIYLGIYKAVNWEVLTGFATWILAGGVFLAVWQQWESRWRARIEYTERRMETLNTQDVKEGLQIAYEKKPSKLNDLQKEEQDKLVHVLELMQALGLLVEMGYADKELAIVAHRGKFIRCWYVLRQCICYERSNRGKYGEGIEYLAKEAYKYQQKKFPKEQWVKLDGKVCEIDISKSCENSEEQV